MSGAATLIFSLNAAKIKRHRTDAWGPDRVTALSRTPVKPQKPARGFCVQLVTGNFNGILHSRCERRAPPNRLPLPQNSCSQIVLRVSNIVKVFGDKRAVDGVSFEVSAGQIVGYLGPNGAGKSTTVKMITGILKPDDGQIEICGSDLISDPIGVKRNLGYVPESADMYPTLTSIEYLSLIAELHGIDRNEARTRIIDLLEAFDVVEAANRHISQLSKGMRQKILLTSALLHNPKVLLLDEPLSGLDVNSVLSFRKLLKGLAELGTAVLYCSHILDVVERLCDRVVLIAGGKVIEDSPTKELVARSVDGTLEGIFRALTVGDEEREQVQSFLKALDGGDTANKDK